MSPFAGFKDFDACVAKQKADGKSDESANKICGALKRDLEKEVVGDNTINVGDNIMVTGRPDLGQGRVVAEPEPGVFRIDMGNFGLGTYGSADLELAQTDPAVQEKAPEEDVDPKIGDIKVFPPKDEDEKRFKEDPVQESVQIIESNGVRTVVRKVRP